MQGAPGQTLTRTKQGLVATARNVPRAIATPGWWRRIGLDSFRDEVMWSEWRGPNAGTWCSWTDNDYLWCRAQLEKDGFSPVGRELIRDAVRAVAGQNRFDSAITWLNGLSWDGIARVDNFVEKYWGAAPSDYTVAVGRYIWSALAGRVLEPGVKADMVPVLVGEGGAQKTSMVAALAPAEEFARRVNLKHDDAEIARRLRGCLVAEIAELRGLRDRDSESLKDFFSARSDNWTPKYMELAATVQRRCVFFGTTDNDAFLTDAVGNYRRWLPVRVGEREGVPGAPGARGVLDVAGMVAVRDQLWAEGAALFRSGGVRWKAAEHLAKIVHHDFIVEDSWTAVVDSWMEGVAEPELANGAVQHSWAEVGFTVKDALTLAVGVPSTSINRGMEMRLASILRGLNAERAPRKGNDLRLWRREKQPKG